VPVPIALVDTADGYVLFDTGMNCDGIRDPDGTWGPRAKVLRPDLVPDDDVAVRLGPVGVPGGGHPPRRQLAPALGSLRGQPALRDCPILVHARSWPSGQNPSGPVGGRLHEKSLRRARALRAQSTGTKRSRPACICSPPTAIRRATSLLLVELASGRRVGCVRTPPTPTPHWRGRCCPRTCGTAARRWRAWAASAPSSRRAPRHPRT
jgi:hypothetical protein